MSIGTAVVDSLLDSPEYQEHLVHRFGDLWHTRVDQFDIVADDFNLDSYEWWFPFARTVGEEPLRLMAHIAANDLPWTEIVTSDTVLTNDLLATIFPVEYLDGSLPEELSTNNLSEWRGSSIYRRSTTRWYLEYKRAVVALSNRCVQHESHAGCDAH